VPAPLRRFTMTKDILITGDSYSCDWTVKYTNQGLGWPNLLAQDYTVTNVAMAGSSIVRTLWQLQSENINDYDAVIVTHTSPNRIYVAEHPIHKDDLLHKNADLIHTDIKHQSQTKPELQCIVDYFEKYYDLDYSRFVYNLIEEKIDGLFNNYTGKVIHMTNLLRDNCYQFTDMLDCSDLIGKRYHGLINHYNNKANTIVYNRVKSLLEENVSCSK